MLCFLNFLLIKESWRNYHRFPTLMINQNCIKCILKYIKKCRLDEWLLSKILNSTVSKLLIYILYWFIFYIAPILHLSPCPWGTLCTSLSNTLSWKCLVSLKTLSLIRVFNYCWSLTLQDSGPPRTGLYCKPTGALTITSQSLKHLMILAQNQRCPFEIWLAESPKETHLRLMLQVYTAMFLAWLLVFGFQETVLSISCKRPHPCSHVSRTLLI